MLHGFAVGLSFRKSVECCGVVPTAERDLRVVFTKHGLSSNAQPTARRTHTNLRAIEEGNLSDDQSAVPALEDAATAVRPVDGNAVEHRGADDDAFRWLERDAHANGGIGKDRWTLHATLRELRPDPEGAVEE